MNYLVTVRYGRMGIVENFETELPDLAADERCVVRTERGDELGDCLSGSSAFPAELPAGLFPLVLRRAHVTDVFSLERFQAEDAVAALDACRKALAELGQELNVVDAELLQGGGQVVFYYEGKFGGDFPAVLAHVGGRLGASVLFTKASSRQQEKTMLSTVVEYQSGQGGGPVAGGCGQPNCGGGKCGSESEAGEGEGKAEGGGCTKCSVKDLVKNIGRAPERPASPRALEFVEVPGAAGLVVGAALMAAVEGKVVAVVRTERAYFAVDNTCPHAGGPLAEGRVENEAISCPLHDWSFDLATGRELDGRSAKVESYPVKVEDGKVFVNVWPEIPLGG
ncbi:MAG: nitrite reductase (NAD(P)H) small subunit [Planctomycetes bacterium]|nr:nitrite reductase (NAD(P)H) small subunit [Planctomycetota bacterium]